MMKAEQIKNMAVDGKTLRDNSLLIPLAVAATDANYRH
jgi:hypothetical protein